jgi:CTP-dependent riboflavin kinase
VPGRAPPADRVQAVVVSGRREAAGFIRVPWVSRQLQDLLGREPYPGTLNLRVGQPDSLAAWRRRVATGAGSQSLPASQPGFCDSSYFPVILNSTIRCGVILPHVADYPEDVVELVAAEDLRGRFALHDGDAVTLDWLG